MVSSAAGICTTPSSSQVAHEVPVDADEWQIYFKAIEGGEPRDDRIGLKPDQKEKRDETKTRNTKTDDRATAPGAPNYGGINNYSDTTKSELEQEMRRLAETKAKIEAEVRENIEFMRLIRGRREKVAEQSENLRKSISPENRNSAPNSRSGSETPPPLRLRPLSPSPARKACQEAYANMSPLMEHLMRDQLHWDGIRRRDTRREAGERRDWEKYLQRSSRKKRSEVSHGDRESDSETRTRSHLPKLEMQAETKRFEDLWRKRERRELVEGWNTYEDRWRSLSSSLSSVVRLGDLPWPITSVFLTVPHKTVATGVTEHLNQIFSPNAISSFLFSAYHSIDKTKKQRLRDALLRYHPDRFEACWLPKIPEANREREYVREASGIVARILGELLGAENSLEI